MKIYNYDKVTKEFISETNATESPLEKGKYLVPANATTIKVNAVKIGYARVFNEAKKVWEYIIDNRGKTYYLNHEKVHFKLGDEVTSEMTLEQFTADEILEQKKSEKINEINVACAKAITSGFSSDALGDTHTYQSEQTDQLNLIGVVIAGQDDYFKCGIEDADGNVTWNYEKHTIAQLQQVLQDGKVHKQGLLQKANTLKTQVANATTIADVEAIVW